MKDLFNKNERRDTIKTLLIASLFNEPLVDNEILTGMILNEIVEEEKEKRDKEKRK